MAADKRKHERLSLQETVFIELVSGGMGGHEGEMVRCKTIDISHSGLRAGVDRELTVGAILQIGVELPHAEDTLYLAAEVIWCKPDKSQDNTWSAGFQLMNANDSDIETWRKVVTNMGDPSA